jgi:hypothetical protein
MGLRLILLISFIGDAVVNVVALQYDATKCAWLQIFCIGSNEVPSAHINEYNWPFEHLKNFLQSVGSGE